MCRHVMFLLLVAALSSTSVAQGAKIIWVADNLRYNFDTNEPADIGFVQLLRDQGHDVDYKGEYMPHEPGNDEAPLNPEWQYWRELDPNKIAELEAADLIIVARDVASSTYDDTDEAEMWNAISTPLIMQGPHLARRLSKWGWFDSGSTSNKTPRLMTVTAPDHPIFAGVELDPNGAVALVDPNTKVTLIKDPDIGAGNGRVLGLHDEGLTWIAEWDAGVEFYEGSTTFAGGPRMWFGSAVGTSDEALGYVEGASNLTAEGEVIFLNAVNYMLNKNTKIIWVSDNLGYNFDEGVPADQGFVDLLTAQGYMVDYRGQYDPHVEGDDETPVNPEWTYWRELDPNKMAALNAADLVIIARDCASSTYDDDPNANVEGDDEPTLWNSVTTPMLMQSAHIARSNKWGWFNSTGTAYAKDAMATVVDADHPVFAGAAIDANDQVEILSAEWNVDCVKDISEAGNGTVLATRAESGLVLIATWQTGQEYFEGSGHIAGGPRMFFASGTGSKNTVEDGTYNLTVDGGIMFLNAVAYMLTSAPTPADNLVHSYTFEDGTANDSVGAAHGTLVGDAMVADGSLILDGDGDWMEMPGDVIAMNTFSEVTIEAWFTSVAGANAGFHMLAAFGEEGTGAATWAGYKYLFVTPARGDDVSRAAIQTKSMDDSPWDDETGVSASVEHDDGLTYHFVVTVNAAEIAFYIDGALVGNAALAEGNAISGISQAVAYLGKGVYPADPLWTGAIHEFNIYNRALSDAEIAALAGM